MTTMSFVVFFYPPTLTRHCFCTKKSVFCSIIPYIMPKTVFLILALTVNYAIFSQERSARLVKPFHTIEVTSGIDLYLRQGDTTKIEVVCEKAFIKRIETTITDSTLTIKSTPTMRWDYDKSPKVYVVFSDLRTLIATSGADVFGSGIFNIPSFAIFAHSGSDVYLTTDCKTIKINASGGSDVKVTGKANSLVAHITGGSDLNTADLKTNHCDVTASGGSDVIVNVALSLSANSSGGSDIGYIGNPPIKELIETGGSDIYRK